MRRRVRRGRWVNAIMYGAAMSVATRERSLVDTGAAEKDIDLQDDGRGHLPYPAPLVQERESRVVGVGLPAQPGGEGLTLCVPGGKVSVVVVYVVARGAMS